MLQFFQFDCGGLKKKKNLWFVCEKNSWDRWRNSNLIPWQDELMRRARRLVDSRLLIGFQALCANVSAGLFLFFLVFIQRAFSWRSAGVVSWGSSATTEGLHRTARQRHWTCAPSRTGQTGQTGQAVRCCSDCRCPCRLSHWLQMKQKQETRLVTTFILQYL